MKRSKHSLSHYNLLTGDMGELLPIGAVEVLPGDTFQHQTSALIRVSPLVSPVMHPVNVRIHHWFVPYRLLWSGWEDFATGNGGTIPTVTVPATPSTNAPLLDYLGIPISQVVGKNLNAFAVRAYNKVYNEFYRDQDLITEVSEDNLTLQKISWGKDRFTTARPWQQKGTAVTIPIGDSAPITGLGSPNQTFATGPVNVYETDGTGTTSYAKYDDSSTTNSLYIEEDPNNAGFPNIRADLSSATAINAVEFREAFALQRYKEARARYGDKYVDYLRFIGINPRDSRLQRPEYLGGGRQTISFSEVLSTADSGSYTVGDMLGHGIAATRSNRYRRFFEEHGVVLSLLSVRPKSIYDTGVHRMWTRDSFDDYYQQELETIGQAEIRVDELYADNSATDDDVFGYGDRYREYREHPSNVAGKFRTTLNTWHLGRSLGAAPTLNQTFIECTPSKRVHADTSGDTLYCMVNHSIQARRLVKRAPTARLI